MTAPSSGPSRLAVAVAFGIVYVVWGSTFLASRFAVETLPPLMTVAVRCLLAGAVLYAIVRRREAPPTRRHWRTATIAGSLLFLTGQGTMTRTLQTVPSGLAALVLASTPIWMVLIHWCMPNGRRPTRREAIGLTVGMVGVGLLVIPTAGGIENGVDLASAGMLLVAAMSWAGGSIYSREAELPTTPGVATAMQLLGGGAALLVASVLSGETSRLQLAGISQRSAISLLYLIVFGTLVGFSAFNWLLRNTSPARLGSYAYVNPIVAVLLGWALAGEPLSSRTLLAMAIIVSAVALVVTRPPDRRRKSSNLVKPT